MTTNHNSLYRTYRPSTFKDVAGHKNVVEILTTELKNNTFGHAYLFAGQRGTGKTSMARIFAKAVNCLDLQNGNPCDECENCIAFNENKFSDIYEIDAASNNGVDEIRNIKSNIQTLPIIGKYKVYIIDEVHMLTKGAFNALLKTLEEPPVHAIFILATTEYDQIPQTIVSRCQTFSFKKISSNDLKERIEYITKNEGYEIDESAANEIYSISEGSLRDALNVLEQLMVITSDTKTITVNDIKKVFYIATKEEKVEILKEILNKESTKVIKYFEEAKKNGMDFDVFSLSLIKIVKEIIEYKITKDKTLMDEIEVSDAVMFDEVELKDLFNITDNLTEAYIKTNKNNASFDYILLSVLKSIETTSMKYNLEGTSSVNQTKEVIEEPKIEEVLEQQETTIESEPTVESIIETEEQKSEETIEQTIEEPTIEVNEIKNEEAEEDINKTLSFDEYSKIINNQDEVLSINENDSFNEVEEIRDVTLEVEQETTIESEPTVEVIEEKTLAITPLEMYNLQTELAINDTSTKEINYLVESLVNVLLGVIKDRNPNLRHELTNKIEEVFETNEDGEFKNVEAANKFVALYDSVVVAASNNEIIIQTENMTQASLINKKLTDDNFRNDVFSVLGKEYVIYAISKNEWAGTKNTFANLKQKNILPQYNEIDINNFYLENKNKVSNLTSKKNEDILKQADGFFEIDDLEIGE